MHANEPEEQEPRDYDDVDFVIAQESLGDALDTMETFEVAFGLGSVERQALADVFESMWNRLNEAPGHERKAYRNLASLSKAIAEFRAGPRTGSRL